MNRFEIEADIAFFEKCLELEEPYENIVTVNISKQICERVIKILKEKSDILEVLAEAELLHPYKIVGLPNTYSQYNEGWMDALAYIDSRLLREVE